MIEVIDYDKTIEFDIVLDALSVLHHMIDMTDNKDIKCNFKDVNCWKENDTYFIRRAKNWES